MHLKRAALFAMMLALPWVLHAQAIPNGPATADEIPRYELGLNYNYFHANAPPGQCGCFSLNGGSGTIVVNLTPAWSGVADVAYAHANNVNNTSQNITIINYLFGPRYSRRTSSRFRSAAGCRTPLSAGQRRRRRSLVTRPGAAQHWADCAGRFGEISTPSSRKR